MPNLNYAVSVTGIGGAIAASVPRTADSGSGLEITLPAGKIGTLTTRTDAHNGTLTMNSGHGITNGAIVDIYFAGGVAYGATVGTVSTNSVPFTTSGGTDLPSTSTAIVACVQVPINVALDGDNAKIVAVNPKYTDPTEASQSHVSFLDVSSASVAAITMNANTPQVWDIQGGSANPFTGNPITSAVASNGSSAGSATLQIYFVQDATP